MRQIILAINALLKFKAYTPLSMYWDWRAVWLAYSP